MREVADRRGSEKCSTKKEGKYKYCTNKNMRHGGDQMVVSGMWVRYTYAKKWRLVEYETSSDGCDDTMLREP